MKRPRRRIEYREHEDPQKAGFPDISGVASASECTGLTHKAPRDKAEWDSYQELSPMAIPKDGAPGK